MITIDQNNKEQEMENSRFKFRVWDKCMQGYVKENLGEKYVWIEDDGQLGAGIDDDSCILEQCTGLKDKNGNLIYEGDIVIEGGNKGVVKYGTLNCGCCDGVYGWYFDGLNGQTDIRCYEFCEVIGNIHEQKDDK